MSRPQLKLALIGRRWLWQRPAL